MFAKAQGYDLILADGVLFATAAMDVTGRAGGAEESPSRRSCAGRACFASGPGPRTRQALIARPLGLMSSGTVSHRLGALAVRFGCSLRGDPDSVVGSVASLRGGGSSLGFVANLALREQLRRHAARRSGG